LTKGTHVGIMGIGVYIPDQVMTAAEIAAQTNGVWTEQAIIEKLGIIEKRVPTKEEGTQEMGALAALDCLANSSIDAKEIDVILCFGEEWKEYPLTTSALYIQDRIGATNAWGIDVQNRCATSVTAMKMAKDMLIADDDINTILVCGGYRNGDLIDYSDKNMSMMYNLGAGGGALLLRKNYGKNVLLGTHIIGDGSISRTAGVEIGGTVNPITDKNFQEAYKSLRLMEPEKMKKRLNAVSSNNWMTCIERAFEKSNIDISKLGYLDILHIKRSAHMGMLKTLELSAEQTTYLERYGHIGQVDQILSLYLGIKQGKIKDQTVVSMIAAGIGYVWAANVIVWGEYQ
jgi:3-oxoacyl-[acyl-carrier-protein] synthase III